MTTEAHRLIHTQLMRPFRFHAERLAAYNMYHFLSMLSDRAHVLYTHQERLVPLDYACIFPHFHPCLVSRYID